MLRQILTIVLPLLAPTVFYLLWLWLRRRQRPGAPLSINLRRSLVLLGIGLALTMAVLMFESLSGQTARTARYAPAYVQDGVIIPGRIIEPE